MRLLLSKILRIYTKNIPPYNCYAGLYMPQAIHETCDCKIFCKFPPKGNTELKINACQNNLYQESYLLKYFIKKIQKIILY